MQDYVSQYEVEYSHHQIKKLTPYLDNIITNSKNPKAITYLTLKQRAFAWYYVHNTNNKANAYKLAYYCTYSIKNKKLELKDSCPSNVQLSVNGGELYRKHYIQKAIEKIRDELIKEISTEVPQTIYEQLQIQSTYDPAMFYNADGTIKFDDWEEIPDKYRCCVISMEPKMIGKDDKEVIVLKLADRDKARVELMKIVPNLLLPEKKKIQFTTINADGEEIGMDFSKMSDAELKAAFSEEE